MGSETKIQWTDASWNPIRGCSRISPGCGASNGGGCYAERHAARFSDVGLPFHGFARRTSAGPRWTGKVEIVPNHLADPIRWRTPKRIFVNSMSDLFHENLSDEDIDRVFGVMHACEFLGAEGFPGHVFQILTKRADRLAAYVLQDRRPQWARWAIHYGGGRDPDGLYDQIAYRKTLHPRIHFGISVEDQERLEERLPWLLRTPAAVRFLSCEPLLGPLDLDFNAIEIACEQDGYGNSVVEGPLHWVIVGGESGPRSRPFWLKWARDIVAQCKAAGVACFVKQLGAHPMDSSVGSMERFALEDRKGGNPEEWPEDLRIREFPEPRA